MKGRLTERITMYFFINKTPKPQNNFFEIIQTFGLIRESNWTELNNNSNRIGWRLRHRTSQYFIIKNLCAEYHPTLFQIHVYGTFVAKIPHIQSKPTQLPSWLANFYQSHDYTANLCTLQCDDFVDDELCDFLIL